LTIRGEIVKGKNIRNAFDRYEKKVTSGVERTVLQLAIKLTALVKRKLGGDVLKVRTGRLRRSINYRLFRRESSVVATVGTNVKYGAVHELGGKFQVPAHMRMQTMAWGKLMKQPRKVNVRSHTANYPQRSFLVASLREMEPEIERELRAVLKQERLQ
jgi:phage gpG-like protein